MNTKNLIISLLFYALISTTSDALARPELTPEQLAKAQEVASQMNPPVDFDALLDEADRLGVDCSDKNLTIRANIKTCMYRIENVKLDEENARLDNEAIQMINELSDKAEKKLSQ